MLAVKPQNAAATLPALLRRFAPNTVFLSIMAGRTIAGIAALIGSSAAIVRAMPNTPAAVRQGVTVGCPSPNVSTPQQALCDRLLQAIGKVAWVEDEALLDPVTAVSGSGPAYVFLLAELMEQAAIEQGIPPDLARLLARQTVSGSGRAARRQPGGRRRPARRRHQPRRHHGRGAVGPDEPGRLADRDVPGDRRRHQAIPRTGRLSPMPAHPISIQ